MLKMLEAQENDISKTSARKVVLMDMKLWSHDHNSWFTAEPKFYCRGDVKFFKIKSR